MLNKGCGGSAVCLVKSGVRGECVCPPLQAGKYARGPDGVSHLTCARKLNNPLHELMSGICCYSSCWGGGGGGGVAN